MKEFISIATFTYPHEYLLLKPLLDQENISYYFQDETIVGIFPLYSNALGGIQLKVLKADIKKAKAVLEALFNPSLNLKIV